MINFKLCNNGKSVVGTREDGATVSYSIEAEEYKQWLAEGNTPEPEFTAEELLANAKTSKLQELETAFIIASKLPVTVGTKTYNGGKESAQALRDYIQLVTDSGGTVCTIWDINNATANYTLAEAKAIMLAIATPVSQAEFNMNAKKNAVNVATTITAVNAVVW